MTADNGCRWTRWAACWLAMALCGCDVMFGDTSGTRHHKFGDGHRIGDTWRAKDGLTVGLAGLLRHPGTACKTCCALCIGQVVGLLGIAPNQGGGVGRFFKPTGAPVRPSQWRGGGLGCRLDSGPDG